MTVSLPSTVRNFRPQILIYNHFRRYSAHDTESLFAHARA